MISLEHPGLKNFFEDKSKEYTDFRREILAHLPKNKDKLFLGSTSKKCYELVNKDWRFALSLSPRIERKEVIKYAQNRAWKQINWGVDFPNCTSLDLSFDGILTDTELKLFHRMTNLKVLKIEQCSEISKEGINNLSSMSNLEKLDLIGLDLKSPLLFSSNLRSLHVDSCQMGRFPSLQNISKLEILSFKNCKDIYDVRLKEDATSLLTLIFDKCSSIPLDVLEKTPLLTNLVCSSYENGTLDVKKVSKLAATLESLNLSDSIISRKSLQSIAKKCTSLLSLEMNRTDPDISLIAEHLTKLTRLEIEECPIQNYENLKLLSNLNVLSTSKDIEDYLDKLTDQWKNLRVLHISGVMNKNIDSFSKLKNLQELYFQPGRTSLEKFKSLTILKSLRILKSGYVNVHQIFRMLPQLKEYQIVYEMGTITLGPTYSKRIFDELSTFEHLRLRCKDLLDPLEFKALEVSCILILCGVMSWVYSMYSIITYTKEDDRVPNAYATLSFAAGLALMGFSTKVMLQGRLGLSDRFAKKIYDKMRIS